MKPATRHEDEAPDALFRVTKFDIFNGLVDSQCLRHLTKNELIIFARYWRNGNSQSLEAYPALADLARDLGHSHTRHASAARAMLVKRGLLIPIAERGAHEYRCRLSLPKPEQVAGPNPRRKSSGVSAASPRRKAATTPDVNRRGRADGSRRGTPDETLRATPDETLHRSIERDNKRDNYCPGAAHAATNGRGKPQGYRAFCAAWQVAKRVELGDDYEPPKRDWAIIARAWHQLGENERLALDVVRIYFADSAPFYGGHPANLFLRDLDKFRLYAVRGRPANGNGHGFNRSRRRPIMVNAPRPDADQRGIQNFE